MEQIKQIIEFLDLEYDKAEKFCRRSQDEYDEVSAMEVSKSGNILAFCQQDKKAELDRLERDERDYSKVMDTLSKVRKKIEKITGRIYLCTKE